MAPDTSGSRPKRSQVVRACDWCRQHRSKCDNKVPCQNCQSRGNRCSNETIQGTSLPAAYQEIERLRRQVQDLEEELKKERDKDARSLSNAPSKTQPTPPHSVSTEYSPSTAANVVDAEPSRGIYDNCNPGDLWGGVKISTTRSPNKIWYGPSSLFYFIGCVAAFLGSRVPEHEPSSSILEVNSTGMLLDEPEKSSQSTARASDGVESDSPTGKHHLTPTQEEYFLSLYWQSYHCIVPILDESEFKEHYRSLWSNSKGRKREPSAVVDLVLALCMQYGVPLMPPHQRKLVAGDATVAGRWYYRRSQALLLHDLESPSLTTFQCHMLSVTYLCCGTFQNMADSVYGLAVRQAYMLGLHLEPSADLSSRERALRKRLWWVLYMFDSKIGMKLGRPFLLSAPSPSSLMPTDSFEAAMDTGSSFAPLGEGATWLSFHLYHTSLHQVVRSVYVRFFRSNPPRTEGVKVQHDAAAMEHYASILHGHRKDFDHWVESVPGPLRNHRAGGKRAFSTDPSALAMDPFAPAWVQLQRTVLELTYHHLCTNLSRLLLSVTKPPRPGSQAYAAATNAALHATAVTRITHQVMSSSTILTGYHEAFQWQWNSAMTLIGYLLAYPLGSDVADAREVVDLAIEVFDMYGPNFSVALSAAKITRNLSAQADVLAQRSLAELPGERIRDPSRARSSGNETTDSWTSQAADAASAFDRNVELDATVIQDTMSLAFDIDEWMAMNTLWSPDGQHVMY